MIDLKKLKRAVNKFLKDSLNEFTSNNPDVGVSCFGFYCLGFSGDALAFFDTPSHAKEKVREQDEYVASQKSDKGVIDLMGKARFRNWIQILESRGRDSLGRFNASCNDFAFPAGDLEFPNWPDPDAELEEDTWDFQWPDGRISTADPMQGDAEIDRELFPFLIECLEGLDISNLKTEGIFRLGVEMHGETYVKFWVPKALQPKGYRPYEYCYKQLGH